MMQAHVPAISVLMTSYNRERYIASAIKSVLQQTFRDFELLIVDDGSTDGTLDVARSFADSDARIRVVANERNLGQFPNRNRAAELARAPLMKYHDSDDLMYPHCLEVMVGMLTAEPRAGFGLSTGWSWSGGPCPMLLTPRMAYQREYFGPGVFGGGPSSAIFRTDVFRGLGGFVDRGIPSDYVFWLRACTRVNLALLPADLFWYRSHPAQELQSPAAARQYAAMAGEAWRALCDPDCPLTPEERDRAKRNRAYHFAKRMVEDVRRGRVAVAWHRLQHCGLKAADWATYLRRPRRDDMAGTPTDDQGEFVMPAWLQ
jgi:glycosyltransferase involved in cell wall biosynthesis